MKLLNERAVVVDVETSGSNPFRHTVLAVAIAPMVRDRAPLLVHVRPDHIEWNEYARTNFPRYATDWEATAMRPDEACHAIEDYLGREFGGEDVTPFGHNIGFDVAFLRKLAFLGGRNELAHLSRRAVDTHSLLYVLASRGKIQTSALSSDGAFRYFGITISEGVRHTALGDAIATRELLFKLLELL